jgi:hypothetical protein
LDLFDDTSVSLANSSKEHPMNVVPFAIFASTALVAVVGLPAQSASATDISMTIVGGALTISVPATSNLGTYTNTVGDGELSGSLGDVTVSDARSAAAGSWWEATVIATALTPTTGPTIGAALIEYRCGDITQVGVATFVATDQEDLTGVVPVVTASGITGDNSATWNPTITVKIDSGKAAGTYTGTITHSVS